MLNLMKTLTDHKVVRFITIGVCATIMHVVVVSLLLELHLLTVEIANVMAFILATIFSFYMNTHWSFEQTITTSNTIRFTIVSCMGCTITYLIAATMDDAGYHYLIGIAAIVTTVPIFTYLLHSRWTYKIDL